uniref:Exosome complex component RRP45 n=1 Tax=Phlebotomus kandelakii TaxID=1109342 RepID=A0A6B2E7K9_9DIPT
MREKIVTNVEKAFVNKCISQNLRIDGRRMNDVRNVKLSFGSEWGSVHVMLGETRVLVQVSCDVAQPKAVRPQEGLLSINVDIGPMAAAHFEAGRASDEAIQISRILERAFKDSRCVDLESLCLVAEEKVWSVRVDVNVLNHDGNIIDCASVAVLAALSHFRRPDVTWSGTEFTIHSHMEKDPIPLVLHHFPLCVSYVIFQDGTVACADPTDLEERVAQAKVVFGLNSYQELCGLHLGGVTLLSAGFVVDLASRGVKHAKNHIEMIKKCLEEDSRKRQEGERISFVRCLEVGDIKSSHQERIPIKIPSRGVRERRKKVKVEANGAEEDGFEIQPVGAGSAVLMEVENFGLGGPSKWIPEENSATSSEEEEVEQKPRVKTESGSEEEATVISLSI